MKDKKELVTTQNNTPADMIRLAVEGKADLDKLEKLLILQERYEANEARKAYNAAMSEFKANPPEIDKDKTVKFGTTKYNHASLYNVTEKINSALSKYGLSASWTTKQNGQVVVTCKITHVKGHSEETSLSAPADTSGSKNAIQAIGSTITYLERYSLLALTGLATYDQDDDGPAAASEVLITDQQAHLLTDMILATNANMEKFLKYMAVKDIKEIPVSQYQKATAALDAHGKQAKVGK